MRSLSGGHTLKTQWNNETRGGQEVRCNHIPFSLESTESKKYHKVFNSLQELTSRKTRIDRTNIQHVLWPGGMRSAKELSLVIVEGQTRDLFNYDKTPRNNDIGGNIYIGFPMTRMTSVGGCFLWADGHLLVVDSCEQTDICWWLIPVGRRTSVGGCFLWAIGHLLVVVSCDRKVICWWLLLGIHKNYARRGHYWEYIRPTPGVVSMAMAMLMAIAIGHGHYKLIFRAFGLRETFWINWCLFTSSYSRPSAYERYSAEASFFTSSYSGPSAYEKYYEETHFSNNKSK